MTTHEIFFNESLTHARGIQYSKEQPITTTYDGYYACLLDEGTSRLSEGVSDDVDGRLALGLLLRVQIDVSHFLARVEQRVLAALGQDVLVSARSDRMSRFGLFSRRGEEREQEGATRGGGEGRGGEGRGEMRYF